MKKLKNTILLTSMLSLILTGCTSKETENFNDYIENGKYVKAAKYYKNNKSSIEVDDMSKIVSDAAESIFNEYQNGETTFSAASANLKALLSIAPKKCEEALNEKIDLINLIDDSREQYRLGEEAFNSESYSEAIGYFSNVIEEDSYYSDAQSKLSIANAKIEEEYKKLETQTTNEILSYIDQGKYEQAVEALNDFKSNCTDKSLIDKLNNEIENVIKSDMDDKVASYFAEFNYSSAYNYVQNLSNTFDYKSINDKLNSLESDFISYALAEAEKDANSENYESASAVIETAMQEIGEDNEALNAAYNEYQSYLPVFLTDLSTLSYDGNLNIDTADDIRDNTGVLHRHSLFVRKADPHYCGGGGPGVESYVEYFTNGKYSIFSGVCGVSNNKKSATGRSSYFKVFGDGELIYTSPTMTPGSLPVEFNIDISNVRVIKIWYPRTESGGGWDNAISVIYDGLLTPKKKSTEEPTQAPTQAPTDLTVAE